MAFNPFHWFRKRQKTMLAGLAIFTMFIFVLQFGRGDAVETMLGYFGGRNRKDPTEVATLYGKQVTVGELQDLLRARELARDVMQRALGEGQVDFMKDARGAFAKADGLDGRQLGEALNGWTMRMAGRTPLDRGRDEIVRDLRNLGRVRMGLLRQNKDETARVVAKFVRVLEFDLWRHSARSNDSYFGGPLTTEGLLDFLLWKRQADKLGIVLTPADVRKQVNEEAMTEVFDGEPSKDAAKALALSGQRDAMTTTADSIYQALADEFRVRLAHEALTGVQPGARAYAGMGSASNDSPSHQTPEQFYEAYKDNRTELNVVMMALPVEKFVGKVTAAPSDEEARTLYNRYKEIEPTPDREKPAFKEPRRVRLEWVAANADAPYYAKKSAEVMPQLDVVRQLSGLGAVEASGAVPVATLQTLAVLRKDPAGLRLAAEYEAYSGAAKNWLEDRVQYDGTHPSDVGRLHLPENFAAAVGQVMASAGTQFAAPAIDFSLSQAMRAATQERQNDLSRRAATSVLAATSFPAGTLPLTAVTEQAAVLYRPVKTRAEVKDRLAEMSSGRYADDLVAGRRDEFRKALEGKSTKDAAEYVKANAVPEQGLTRHAQMPAALDRYEFDKATELAPLKRAFVNMFSFQPDRMPPFSAAFFGEDQKLYKPESLSEDMMFAPQRNLLLVWKTEDRKAYVPSFADARPKVDAAWRFDKARELAKQEAQAVAAAASKKRDEGGNAERFLRDEQVRRGLTVFDLPGPVAKLVPQLFSRAGVDTDYDSYRFPESQIAFPRPDTLDELLKALKKPGDATVLRDRPDRNYYVAVLIDRSEPTPDKFYSVYERTRGLFGRDLLWNRFERDRQEKFLADMLKQLRAEAKAPVDDNGFYVLDADVTKKIDRRAGDAGG